MKRIAILLLSVVFLLTALPWGAVSASTGSNLVFNGGFEYGLDGWSCNSGTATIVSDAYSGSSALQLTNPNSWGEAAVQTVCVSSYTDYTLTWYAKRVSGKGAFNLIPMNPDNWANLSCSGQNWMNETSGNWVKYEITFNTGSATQVFLKLTSEVSNAGSIIIDDITLPGAWGDLPDEPDEPVVSGDNLLVNGDFEYGDITGWDNLWGNNIITMVDGHSGAYGMHVVSGQWTHVRQRVEVEPNTDYIITGWYKNVTDMTLLIKNAADTTNMYQSHMNGGNDWTQVTLEINSGDEWAIYISLMGNDADSQGTFDEFVMTRKGAYVPDEPSEPDLPTSSVWVFNGDFETGDSSGWTTHQGSSVKWDASYNGNYGMHLKGDGGWGGMAYQDISVQPGREYVVRMWLRTIATGVNIQIKDGSNNGDVLAQSWFNGTAWRELSFTVIPTTDVLCINFCGGGTGWNESVYLDDVTVIGATPSEPDESNGIANGDFETGDFSGWENLWGSNTITMVSGHDSDYGMKVNASLYSQVRQKVQVEPNTDYILTCWYRNVRNMTLLVKDGADSWNINQGAFTNGSYEWTQMTLEFNSDNYTELIISLMGYESNAYGTFDDLSLTKKGIDEPVEPVIGKELINGDFEQGDAGWYLNSSYAYVSGNYAYSGDYSLMLDNPSAWSEAASQTILVEPHTDYEITWYSKRVSGYGAFYLCSQDGDTYENLTVVKGQHWMSETSGNWVQNRIVVSTGDSTKMMLKWSTDYYSPGKMLIDDITIAVKEPVDPTVDLIQNGDFSDGTEGWILGGTTDAEWDYAYGALPAMRMETTAAYESALEQWVTVEPYTDYELSFHVSGSDSGKSGYWMTVLMAPDMMTNVAGQWYYVYGYRVGDWETVHLRFNSGNYSELLLRFSAETNYGGTCLLDDVHMYQEGYMPEEPQVTPIIPPTLTSYGVVNNRPISEEVNLLENGSFESKGGQWNVDTFCSEYVSVVEDVTTKFGNHSLYFDTSSLSEAEETKVTFTVDVQPYTDYVFSMWIKGDFLSESNSGRATIGVANSNGKFLSNRDVMFLDGTRQIVPTAWDNQWHLRSVEFNTQSSTTITIAMAGWGSQMWVDDMALFLVGDGTKYVSANMAGDVEVSYNVDSTHCKDEDSLIPDPTMSTADAAGFWADAYGWRNGFVSFAEGAMKYTSTGDNAATSIIKWVDVEPYTDYTFTMRIKILEDGDGRLELIDSKYWDKETFYTVSFDSYDYDEFDSDGWYTISLCFNSDAYDRIGIVFVDDGGEVLLDNMRLFKSEDGVAAVMGDINGDGKINTRDVGLFQRYLNGWKVIILTEAADVNGDGKINVQDIAVLQRYLCGWDIRLGG